MSKYRIITNGYQFRVQHKCRAWMPFWSTAKEYYGLIDYYRNFETLEDAQKYIDRDKARAAVQSAPWRPV